MKPTLTKYHIYNLIKYLVDKKDMKYAFIITLIISKGYKFKDILSKTKKGLSDTMDNLGGELIQDYYSSLNNHLPVIDITIQGFNKKLKIIQKQYNSYVDEQDKIEFTGNQIVGMFTYETIRRTHFYNYYWDIYYWQNKGHEFALKETARYMNRITNINDVADYIGVDRI